MVLNIQARQLRVPLKGLSGELAVGVFIEKVTSTAARSHLVRSYAFDDNKFGARNFIALPIPPGTLDTNSRR